MLDLFWLHTHLVLGHMGAITVASRVQVMALIMGDCLELIAVVT
jgi:hypothetical protein